MRYAKLQNGALHYAPKKITDGEAVIYNPTAATLTALGYLPVVETDAPETDAQHYAEPKWMEKDEQIVQEWEVKEIPISEEEALTRYANELTGANDPDLISAAETLIDKYSESKDKAEAYDILIGGAE